MYVSPRLGLAYAGSNRQEVLSLILPVLGDPKSNLEVRCLTTGYFYIYSKPLLLNYHFFFRCIGDWYGEYSLWPCCYWNM